MNAQQIAQQRVAELKAKQAAQATKTLVTENKESAKFDGRSTKSANQVYFARTPHSKFIFSDGTEAIFHFGRLQVGPDTYPGDYNRPPGYGQQESKNNGRLKYLVYQEELDAICPPQGNNPMIFKQNNLGPEDFSLPDNLNPAKNAATEDARMDMAGTRVTGEVNNGTSGQNMNSTIDPDLMRAAQNQNSSVVGNTTQVIQPIAEADLSQLNTSSSVG